MDENSNFNPWGDIRPAIPFFQQVFYFVTVRGGEDYDKKGYDSGMFPTTLLLFPIFVQKNKIIKHIASKKSIQGQ